MSAAAGEAAPAIHALVVDDDPMIVGLLRMFLARRGYAVEQCEDGESALDRIRAGGINLVITDRNMPRMDGLALCRAIRDLGGPTYVYSIMLTASGEQASLVAAMEAGVDDFLAKPVSLAELGARLRAAERVLSLEAGLAQRNAQLAQAYAQLQGELELARVLQVGRLPPPARFGRFAFAWQFEACRYVGGDTFDYFPVGERHLCFYLADVSGHGVAAAMMAFHAQHQLRASSQQLAAALARRGADLASAAVAVVGEYNRRFLAMNDPGLYLTMVFGLLDVARGEVALVQAGHPPALYAPAGEQEFRPVGEGSVPIGILDDVGYEASTLQLAPGARLVLHSDGLTDCRDPADEAFGAERLREMLGAQRSAPLARAAEDVHAAVRGWRDGLVLEDDLALLALEAH